MITLGSTARDSISGFKGVVVAMTQWINGRVQVTIAPRALRNGEPIPNHTFDAEQVSPIVEAPQPTPSPGPVRY